MPAGRFGHPMRSEWALDPSVTYLNHGTVGATPRHVLAAQQALRDEIERQPARFLLRELTEIRVGAPDGARPRLRAAADAVADFLGAAGDDLVFVDNVTTGMNAVVRSIPLEPGDEILILDHAYGGVMHAARSLARERAATLRVVEIPWPPTPAAIVQQIADGLGPRTRIAIIDHVTAESALVLPLAEIVATCHAHGVPVAVDGAHAPGAIPVNLRSLGADWYVANLHKWAWTPRSCGILHSLPRHQDRLRPVVASWGVDRGFTAAFDWPGTRDPTPALSAPTAIAFMREIGLDAIQRYDHDLAWRAGQHLAERWGAEVVQSEEQIGSMITLPLPSRYGSDSDAAARLRDALLFEDGIEVQVHAHRNRVQVRVSAQIYNDDEDIERLADAIARR
jgi:isopenicillin-N epimerase